MFDSLEVKSLTSGGRLRSLASRELGLVIPRGASKLVGRCVIENLLTVRFL